VEGGKHGIFFIYLLISYFNTIRKKHIYINVNYIHSKANIKTNKKHNTSGQSGIKVLRHNLINVLYNCMSLRKTINKRHFDKATNIVYLMVAPLQEECNDNAILGSIVL